MHSFVEFFPGTTDWTWLYCSSQQKLTIFRASFWKYRPGKFTRQFDAVPVGRPQLVPPHRGQHAPARHAAHESASPPTRRPSSRHGSRSALDADKKEPTSHAALSRLNATTTEHGLSLSATLESWL